jgi:hypothetical protein
MYLSEYFLNASNAVQHLLPDDVRLGLLFKRRRHHWLKQNLIFIHVPKAAGVSVNQALYGRFMGHFSAQELERCAPEEFATIPTFSVVRNPFDRLVSAYRFAVAGQGEGIGPAARINNVKLYQGPAFRSFDAFVQEWLCLQDIDEIDIVFGKQLPFVADAAGKIMLPFVGRVENMEAVARFVNQHRAEPVVFGHHNRTVRDQDYRSYYSPSTVALVEALYRDDLEAFGYSF